MTSDNEMQRGKRRNRAAASAAIVNLVAKLIGVAIVIVTVPATRNHLGTEAFGLWMTINSFVALLAFADLGLGNGLLNEIAHAKGRDDRAHMRKALTNACVLLTGMGVLAGGLVAVLALIFDLGQAFKLQDPATEATFRHSLLAFACCLFFFLQASLVQRVLGGLQQGFVLGLITIGAQVTGALALLLAIGYGASLPVLVLVLLGLPAALTALVGWVWLKRSMPGLMPRADDVHRGFMRQLFNAGALFLLLQVASSAAFSTDSLIGAVGQGAAAVGDFALAAKLFGIASIAISVICSPLWPAYGEALARGDLTWVKRTLQRSVFWALVVSLLVTLLIWLAFKPVTHWWLKEPLVASGSLLLGLAAAAVATAVGAPIAMFLNSARVVVPQVLIALVFAAVCVALKLLAIGRFGLEVLPWATALTYIAVVWTSYAWLVPRVLRQASTRINSDAS